MRYETGYRENARGSTYSFHSEGAAAVCLFATAALYFLPRLLQGNRQFLSSIDGDTWSQFFYWRQFAFSELARGELPLWNPYNFSGQPFVGAMQSAIFYPLNWFFLIFDTPFAINLSIAIHCFGTSIFTYLFARYIGISAYGSVLSALTFTYSAPYFVHVYPGHLPHLAAMWMPLMFLAMAAFLRHRRMRDAVWAGLCLAMELLAGYPQYPFYSALALSVYFVLHLIFSKERTGLSVLCRGYVVFLITAIAVAAIQLAPTWELVRHSARGAVSYEWISIFSLPPENLLTLLSPNVFGDIVNVPYWGKNNLWEMSVYLGIVPLALLVVALALNRTRQVVVFAVIGGLFLLLALGKHTPFLWLLYTFVPGFSLFRGVGKAAFVFAFAGSLLAGYGFETIRQLIEKADRKLRIVAMSLIGMVLLIGIISFLSAAADPYSWSLSVKSYVATEEHFDALTLNEQFFTAAWRLFWADFWKLCFIALFLAALCWFGPKVFRRSPNFVLLTILLLAAGDLWHFGSRFLVSFDPRILSMDPELKAFLKKENEPFRIATPLAPQRNHLLNIGMLEGVENAGGYDAIVIKSYNEFINLTQGLPVDQPNLLMGINRISSLLNLLNVKYYVVEPSIDVTLPNFDVAFQNNRSKGYRSLNVLPRSFIVPEARVATGIDATFRQMTDAGFDPWSVVILDESVSGLPRNSQSRSPVPKILEYAPKHVVIEAEAVAPGMLVLADSYYPGWRAFIDGRETKVYRANHMMRAVFLPSGRHRVEFRYEPLLFTVGVAITVTALVLLLGFSATVGLQKRRRVQLTSSASIRSANTQPPHKS